jgi:hypothetical protein
MGTLEPSLLRGDWWVAPVAGGPAVATGAAQILLGQDLELRTFFPASPIGEWLPTGEVVFSANLGDSANLWTMPVSERTFHARGPARRLTQGSASELNPRFAPGASGASRYVFSSQESNTDVWTLDIDINQGKALGELRRLTEGAADHQYPTLSADDRKLLFTSNRSGNMDVWLRDMVTGKEAAVTTDPARKTRAIVHPDGKKVAYLVSEDQKYSIFVMPLDGAGESRKLCSDCGNPVSWTPDGKGLLSARDKPIRWLLVDGETGTVSDLLSHPRYDIHRLQISPDGRWLAFNPKIGPRKEPIFVAPYRPGHNSPESEWIEIADGTGYDGRPLWAPSGNLLYFVSNRDGFQCIYAQPLDPSSKRPVGEALTVMHFHSARRPLHDSAGVFLGRRQIVMSLREARGNIWMMEVTK